MEQPYGQSERRSACWICIPRPSSSLSLICLWHGPANAHACVLAYVHAYAAGICTTTAGVLSIWFQQQHHALIQLPCLNTAALIDLC